MESHILILNFSNFAYRRVFFVIHPMIRTKNAIESKGGQC